MIWGLTAALMLVPALLSAQEIKKEKEDENSVTFVEETLTPDGKIVTTTVLEREAVMTNGFWHNWEFSPSVGAHIFFGDNDLKMATLGEMIAFPSIDMQLTKWASPYFGVGLGFSFNRFKGLYQSKKDEWPDGEVKANFQTDVLYTKADPIWDYMILKEQRGWYANPYALLHVDLCGLFGGLNFDRFYRADLYVGGGATITKQFNNLVYSPSFNFGLGNKFRITDRLSLLVNLRGALISDAFDGESYMDEPTKKHWQYNYKSDLDLGATVGLSIDLNSARSRWRTARRESTIQYKEKIVTEKVIVEVEKQDTIRTKQPTPEMWYHINFDLDKWIITSRERVNLQAIAELIKATPQWHYLLVGYADKQTATPAHNQMLSERRVEAVYNLLTQEFGVDPAQLQTDAKGGVDYMFYNEKELSRCVMITIIKDEE